MPMFGLKLKPGSEYVREIQKSFDISGAALEEGEMGKIYVKNKYGKFVLATVNQVIPQTFLNLKFGNREHLAFGVDGDATVSLTGFWDESEAIKIKAPGNVNEENASALLSSNEDDNDKQVNDDKGEEKETDNDCRLFKMSVNYMENGNDGDDENESGDDSDTKAKLQSFKSRFIKLLSENSIQKKVVKEQKKQKVENQKETPPVAKIRPLKNKKCGVKRFINGDVKN